MSKNESQVSTDNLHVLNAKKHVFNALRMYRVAQLKDKLNHGAAYYGGETLWLRNRIATAEAKEDEIDREIQEALRNGN